MTIKTTGEKIKEFRLSLNMSQEEFAETLGLHHRSVVCRYEKNKITPGFRTIYKIIKLAHKHKYFISIEYFRSDLFCEEPE